MNQPTLINLDSNGYNQELHYYSFAISLDTCVSSCKTLNDLSNKVCVSNKREAFKSKPFQHDYRNKLIENIKHISCKCKCEFDSRKCNSNQKCNNDKCWCECKKHHIWEKDYIWNPDTCSCKNGKYLASIIDNSVITYDEIKDADSLRGLDSYHEETKAMFKANFNEKKQPVKRKISILHFLLITIALLIAISIYCYLIKYWVKENHLLPFHVINDQLIKPL